MSFLVGDFKPSEKYESQLGSMMQFPTFGKIKLMLQTTNQINMVGFQSHIIRIANNTTIFMVITPKYR